MLLPSKNKVFTYLLTYLQIFTKLCMCIYIDKILDGIVTFIFPKLWPLIDIRIMLR